MGLRGKMQRFTCVTDLSGLIIDGLSLVIDTALGISLHWYCSYCSCERSSLSPQGAGLTQTTDETTASGLAPDMDFEMDTEEAQQLAAALAMSMGAVDDGPGCLRAKTRCLCCLKL